MRNRLGDPISQPLIGPGCREVSQSLDLAPRAILILADRTSNEAARWKPSGYRWNYSYDPAIEHVAQSAGGIAPVLRFKLTFAV